MSEVTKGSSHSATAINNEGNTSTIGLTGKSLVEVSTSTITIQNTLSTSTRNGEGTTFSVAVESALTNVLPDDNSWEAQSEEQSINLHSQTTPHKAPSVLPLNEYTYKTEHDNCSELHGRNCRTDFASHDIWKMVTEETQTSDHSTPEKAANLVGTTNCVHLMT